MVICVMVVHMIQPKTAARMHGFIRAVADQSHPLQTRLSLILTDFEPNRNKQAIPRAEAENILRTAVNSPLKINFDGTEYYGHKGATPIGTIVEPVMGSDNGREVILAEAIVWNDINPEVDEHIKLAFAEGVGTSWEIYFDEEKSTTDNNGVEWLGGCVFAGTCIVDTPAYGPNRTRLLAIAEELHNRDTNSEKDNMADSTDVTQPNTEDTEVNPSAQAADDAVTFRNDVSAAMTVLSGIYEGFYQMLDESYEIEQQLATTDMSAVAEQFTKMVAGIQKRFDALKNKAAKAEELETELTTIKTAIAEAEEAKAAEVRLNERKSALAEIGIEIAPEKEAFYTSMADDVFTQYVEDMKAVKGSNAKAEVKKPVIPNTSITVTAASLSEVAALIRGDK